jgi:hypothetical protein
MEARWGLIRSDWSASSEKPTAKAAATNEIISRRMIIEYPVAACPAPSSMREDWRSIPSGKLTPLLNHS